MIALLLTLAMMFSLCAAAAPEAEMYTKADRERAIHVLLQSGWTMEEIDDLLTDEAILAYKDALSVEVYNYKNKWGAQGMKKWKRGVLAALAVLMFGALVIRVMALEEQCRYLQRSIDQMFRGYYTSLCLGIPVPEEISEASLREKNDRNLEDAHLCWTIYSLTSYHSVPMNNIVKMLYDLCRAHVQRDAIDGELAQRLNELAHWDFGEEKAQVAWEALQERMKETGVSPYR